MVSGRLKEKAEDRPCVPTAPLNLPCLNSDYTCKCSFNSWIPHKTTHKEDRSYLCLIYFCIPASKVLG